MLALMISQAPLRSHAKERHCSLKSLSYTKALEAYLKVLIDKQILKIEELKEFRENLKDRRLINPISDEGAKTDEARLIHYEGIEEYIQKKIDLNELSKWLDETLKEIERNKKDQSDAEKETIFPYRKMIFHKIPKGSFFMGEKKNVSVTLTNDFMMSDTHITQAQWVALMGENPSSFKDGEGSALMQVKGKLVQLKPDHPVETVSWWSVLEFANRLSQKHGLKPVYDLSKIDFKEGTKAEDGSWKTEEEERFIKLIQQAISAGGIYAQEGYRLPTESEIEYVMTNLGKSNGQFVFGNSEDVLEQYAFYEKNSKGSTHEVALKKTFLIDGKPFFDLHGNVGIWAWDNMYWTYPSVEAGWQTKGGIDPVGDDTGFLRVVRSSSWRSIDSYHYSHHRSLLNSFEHLMNGQIGFRLVRTIK